MKTLSLLSAVFVASLVAACSGGEASTPGGSPAATTEAPTEPPPGTEPTPTPPGTKPPAEPKLSATPPLRSGIDTAVLAELTKGGLDVATLPDDLADAITTRAKRDAVMKSFTLALGVDCEGCHVKSGTRIDFGADSPRKNVAKKMWTSFVRALEQKDGSALYCDSCHQGKMTFLDRKDDEALGSWMKANFVDRLVRKDAAKHDCATCHGKPFDGNFIDSWKK